MGFFSCFHFYKHPNMIDTRYKSKGLFQKAYGQCRFSKTNFIILGPFLGTFIHIKNTKGQEIEEEKQFFEKVCLRVAL